MTIQLNTDAAPASVYTTKLPAEGTTLTFCAVMLFTVTSTIEFAVHAVVYTVAVPEVKVALPADVVRGVPELPVVLATGLILIFVEVTVPEVATMLPVVVVIVPVVNTGGPSSFSPVESTASTTKSCW